MKTAMPLLSFNTQPPEGGWSWIATQAVAIHPFQHTAARRRLVCCQYWICRSIHVSTHSRPKAAGEAVDKYEQWLDVSTHSRPKAAGSIAFGRGANTSVSTHSRPKAAG